MIRNRRLMGPDQRKILRVLLLIEYLYSGKRSVHEIAEELSISPRTAYRYINLLDSVCFEIEQDFEGRYFIVEATCPLCGGNHKTLERTKNQQPLLI